MHEFLWKIFQPSILCRGWLAVDGIFQHRTVDEMCPKISCWVVSHIFFDTAECYNISEWVIMLIYNMCIKYKYIYIYNIVYNYIYIYNYNVYIYIYPIISPKYLHVWWVVSITYPSSCPGILSSRDAVRRLAALWGVNASEVFPSVPELSVEKNPMGLIHGFLWWFNVWWFIWINLMV